MKRYDAWLEERKAQEEVTKEQLARMRQRPSQPLSAIELEELRARS
jgi:hypothetical protein